MEYHQLLDGRRLTIDLTNGEWRLDGFRISEGKAQELLAHEMAQRGLLTACVVCGSTQVVARVRPVDDLAQGRRFPPAPYCAACLPTVMDMSAGVTL